MAGASLETRYTASAPPPSNFPRDIHWSPRALGYARRLHTDISPQQSPESKCCRSPRSRRRGRTTRSGMCACESAPCQYPCCEAWRVVWSRRFTLPAQSLPSYKKINCLLFSPQSYLTRVDQRFETDLAMRFLEVSDQWLAPNLSFQVLIPRPFTCANMRMPLQVR